MFENAAESSDPQEGPFEGFNFMDLPDDLSVEAIINERPVEVKLDFRKPFGEGDETPETDAKQAAQSFHGMLDELFEEFPGAHQEMNGNTSVTQRLELEINTADGKVVTANIFRIGRIGEGYSCEKVQLFEQDSSVASPSGLHICDYVSATKNPNVDRWDMFSRESVQLMDSIKLTDDNIEEETRNIADAIKLSLGLGLNGQPAGVEEINSLRNFLRAGETSVPRDIV